MQGLFGSDRGHREITSRCFSILFFLELVLGFLLSLLLTNITSSSSEEMMIVLEEVSGRCRFGAGLTVATAISVSGFETIRRLTPIKIEGFFADGASWESLSIGPPSASK